MRQARYAVAKTSDLVPDIGIVVPLGPDGECALFLHENRYYALGSLCPHQNAPLDGAAIISGCVVCRRHGYRFALDSGECLTLAGYGLPVFRTEIDGDTIYVTFWEFD